jgi:6-hydroxytryprostatin B O-methyltransferase
MDVISLKLLQAVRALHSCLDSAGLPNPSFDKNTPPAVLPNDAPLEVQNAREQIMDAALRLFRLAAGPSDHISHARTAVCFDFKLKGYILLIDSGTKMLQPYNGSGIFKSLT